MKRYKVTYFMKGTCYCEHVEVPQTLDYIDGPQMAVCKVKENTPDATDLTAQQI